MTIPLWIIVTTTIATILLAIKARSSSPKNVEEWAVGGRKLGQLFVLFLLAGEIYTVFTFLGATGFAYSHGVAVYYILSYCAIAYSISYFLLPPIWRYGKKHGIFTQPQFLAHRYDSLTLGRLTTCLGVVALVPYTVIQLRGLGVIVYEVSESRVSYNLAVYLGGTVMALYVMISGLRGSTYVAVVKDIAVLFVVIFIGLYIPIHYYGSVSTMFQSIDAAKTEIMSFGPENKTIAWYISSVIVTSLGFLMAPQIFLTIFSSSGENNIKRNAIILPLYTLMLLFVFFVGFAAISQVPGLQGRESDLVLFRVVKQVFPSSMLGLIGAVGILMALVPGSIIIMTTASLISSGISDLSRKQVSSKSELLMSQILVPVISLSCCYLATSYSGTMVTIQLIGYGLATQLVWVVVAAAFPGSPYFTSAGASCGIVAGVAVSSCISLGIISPDILWTQVSPSLAQIDGGVIALVVNLIVAISVTKLGRRRRSISEAALPDRMGSPVIP